MLDYSRFVKKRISLVARIFLLALPVLYIVLTLSQVVLAKNTYLINDGGHVTQHSTYSTDPATVLQEIGLELGENDIFTTEPGDGLSVITVQRRQAITLQYGTTNLHLTSYGESVAELISRYNLYLDEHDVLSVPGDASTFDGMLITVSQSVKRAETYFTTIPFSTSYCYDDNLAKGEQVVLTPGQDGKLLCTADVYYVDGIEVSRDITSQTVTMRPVDCLIAVGTKVETTEPLPMPTEPKPTEPKPTKPAATKPAATEPKPTTPKPTTPKPTTPAPSGNYQISGNTIITADGKELTFSKTLDCIATSYCRTDKGGETTYMGTRTRVGVIAVDPKFIPLGTKLFIVSNDGKYIYGEAVAEDTGGAIKGNKIDLFYETRKEALAFGVRDCTVYVLS